GIAQELRVSAKAMAQRCIAERGTLRLYEHLGRRADRGCGFIAQRLTAEQLKRAQPSEADAGCAMAPRDGIRQRCGGRPSWRTEASEVRPVSMLAAKALPFVVEGFECRLAKGRVPCDAMELQQRATDAGRAVR